MALVFTKTGETTIGNKWLVFGTFAMDSSYPTGGEAISLTADLDLARLDTILCNGEDGFTLVWNGSKTAPLIMAYYSDNNNAADSAQIEVPNATDISSITAAVLWAIGER